MTHEAVRFSDRPRGAMHLRPQKAPDYPGDLVDESMFFSIISADASAGHDDPAAATWPLICGRRHLPSRGLGREGYFGLREWFVQPREAHEPSSDPDSPLRIASRLQKQISEEQARWKGSKVAENVGREGRRLQLMAALMAQDWLGLAVLEHLVQVAPAGASDIARALDVPVDSVALLLADFVRLGATEVEGNHFAATSLAAEVVGNLTRVLETEAVSSSR